MLAAPSVLVATGSREHSLSSSRPALPELGRWLSRGRLVSYRPRRRATVYLDGDDTYVKVLPGRKARPPVRRLEQLQRVLGTASPDVALALPAEVDPGRGALFVEAMPGRSLHDLLLGGAPDDWGWSVWHAPS